jgi:hypothetical protein
MEVVKNSEENSENKRCYANASYDPAAVRFSSKVIVLGVGDHFGVCSGNAAERRLPIAIQYGPLDVILRRRTARVPAGGDIFR